MKAARKYLTATAFGAALALAVFCLRGGFSPADILELTAVSSDSFFVAGAVLLCAGGLIFAEDCGALGFLGFVLRAVGTGAARVFGGGKSVSFPSCRAVRRKRRRFVHLLAVGAAYVAVGAVIYAVYCGI